MLCFKTFDDFIETTAEALGVSLSAAEESVFNQLAERGVSPNAITAYLNWARHPDPMLQRDIAERMNVSLNTVNTWLRGLAEAWPELFHSAPAQIGTGWGQSVTLKMTLTLNINGEGSSHGR